MTAAFMLLDNQSAVKLASPQGLQYLYRHYEPQADAYVLCGLATPGHLTCLCAFGGDYPGKTGL